MKGRSDSPFLPEFGMYGTILSDYLRYFGREKFLILFQEDLISDSEEVLKGVFEEDVALLKDLFSVEPSWPEFRQSSKVA